MPCNFCSDSLEGVTELKHHPQAGETFGHWGSKTERKFYQCQLCQEVWVVETTMFFTQELGTETRALGKNPNIRVGET